MKEVTAYNYDTQQWESGAAAIETRRKQLRQELELLEGPEAASYAKFSGIRDIPAAIQLIRNRLTALNLN